jgi:molybdenum cofactor cytidylyltransferase
MTARVHSQVGAVVLAAGRSSRMGEPKQLLVLEGKPLLQHTLTNLCDAKVRDIVVVLGFAAQAIQHHVQLREARVVENPDYEQGMASSLRAGLAALDPTTDAALIVLADQPSVRPETLNHIIAQYEQSDAQIVVPMYQGFRGNPVLLDRSVFPEVMALKGDIGCRAVFGNHQDGIVKVTVDDIGILLDIDSKDDFAKLLRYGPRDQEPGTLLEAIDLHGRTVPEKEDSPRDSDELIIVGTEPVAIALAKLGRVLQFRVRVVAPLLQDSDLPEADEVIRTLDFSRLPIAPGCCMVIADRGRFDEEAIEQAFGVKIGYVGLVANRKRAEDVRRRLLEIGHAPEDLATLHSPAGLDIGANTPEEIALSILAEIVKAKRHR